jgi:hypothetical protein
MFEPLIEAGRQSEPQRGRPRPRPESVIAHKGYSSERIRNSLKSKAIKPVIPLRFDQGRGESFDREVYRERKGRASDTPAQAVASDRHPV